MSEMITGISENWYYTLGISEMMTLFGALCNWITGISEILHLFFDAPTKHPIHKAQSTKDNPIGLYINDLIGIIG